jgi:hypothetical protein
LGAKHFKSKYLFKDRCLSIGMKTNLYCWSFTLKINTAPRICNNGEDNKNEVSDYENIFMSFIISEIAWGCH